jgi:hypothetical protein
MPLANKLNKIDLDKITANQNTDTKLPESRIFIYYDFSKDIELDFMKLTVEKDGSPNNVLNFRYAGDKKNPCIFVAKNNKFGNDDLEKYVPAKFSITQRIHDSQVMGKSTKADLELIMECTADSKNNNTNPLYFIMMLTEDIPDQSNGNKANTGGDLNLLFKNLQTEKIKNPQITDFETDNLRAAPYNVTLDKSISKQEKVEDRTIPVFYYYDKSKNPIIIMQIPIPINSDNFKIIQTFFEDSKTQVNIVDIFTKTDLAPVENVGFFNDILMKPFSELAKDQKNVPLTPSEQTDQKGEESRDSTTQAAAEKAKKAEGFVTLREGAKAMQCRPSQTGNKLSAALVGAPGTDLASSSVGMQVIITLIAILILVVSILMYGSDFYVGLVTKAEYGGFINSILVGNLDINSETNDLFNQINTRVAQISWASWLFGLLFVISGSVLIGTSFKVSNGNSRYFQILFGILLIVVSFMYYMSIAWAYYMGSLTKKFEESNLYIKNKQLFDDQIKSNGYFDILLKYVWTKIDFYLWYSKIDEDHDNNTIDKIKIRLGIKKT